MNHASDFGYSIDGQLPGKTAEATKDEARPKSAITLDDDLPTVLGELCDRYSYRDVVETLRDITAWQRDRSVGRAFDQWQKLTRKLTEAKAAIEEADQIL